MQDDFLIIEVSYMLSANKNRDYKTSIIARFEALVDFLEANNLVNRKLCPDGDISKVVIMKSDLTDVGFLVIKNALDRWLGATDRRKKDRYNTNILEKELKRQLDISAK